MENPILPNAPAPCHYFLIAGKCWAILLCGGPSEAIVKWSLLSVTGPSRRTAAQCQALPSPQQVALLQKVFLSSQRVECWAPKVTFILLFVSGKLKDTEERKSEDIGNSVINLEKFFLMEAPVGGGEFY